MNGFLPNGAAVNDDQMGVFNGISRTHPLLGKDSRHPFGIRHVHLAAEGLDIEFLIHFVAILYLKTRLSTTM